MEWFGQLCSPAFQHLMKLQKKKKGGGILELERKEGRLCIPSPLSILINNPLAGVGHKNTNYCWKIKAVSQRPLPPFWHQGCLAQSSSKTQGISTIRNCRKPDDSTAIPEPRVWSKSLLQTNGITYRHRAVINCKNPLKGSFTF